MIFHYTQVLSLTCYLSPAKVIWQQHDHKKSIKDILTEKRALSVTKYGKAHGMFSTDLPRALLIVQALLILMSQVSVKPFHCIYRT